MVRGKETEKLRIVVLIYISMIMLTCLFSQMWDAVERTEDDDDKGRVGKMKFSNSTTGSQ